MEPQVRGWWESPLLAPPGAAAVPCRDATAGQSCLEVIRETIDCETVVEPATGEPVRRCLKLYKRYLKCAGSPVKEEQQQETVVARGEGAQQLEPHLAELPSRLGGAAGAPAPAAAGEPAGAAWMEDAAQSVDAFLRFAEALQEELEPGTMQLDHVPPAAARPYSCAEAGASSAQQQQQPPLQQQQSQAQPAADQPFAWLGGLLRGTRRGEASGSTARRCIEPSTWREFEKDFTEV